MLLLFYKQCDYKGKIYMHKKEAKGGGNDMPTMKPIQATPELSGEDAERLIRDVNRKPTKEALERNRKMQDILRRIKK